LQALAHDEGKLDLDARLAIVGVLHLGAVADHLVVEDIAVVRLVDHRGALHCLGGEPDLVPDQLGAGFQLALHDLGRDRVGVLDRDLGKCDMQLRRLLMDSLRLHQNVGGFAAIGGGEHGREPLINNGVMAGLVPAIPLRMALRR
jgi:hypothetical protein